MADLRRQADVAHIINGDKYRSAPESVIARVLARERIVTPEGCWLWGGEATKDGYPTIMYGGGRRGLRISLYVHRLVFMHFKGDPGDDMQVDHLCHDPDACPARDDCPHRRCYNPDHLLAVTPAQNRSRSGKPVVRKKPRTHCHAGHEYTEANTYWYNGQRQCRKCNSLRVTARKKAVRRAARKPCRDCGSDMAERPIRAMYCAECVEKRNLEKGRRYHRNVGSAKDKAKTRERRQGRCCATCGVDISDRKADAVYCGDCMKARARAASRDRWRQFSSRTTHDDGRAA